MLCFFSHESRECRHACDVGLVLGNPHLIGGVSVETVLRKRQCRGGDIDYGEVHAPRSGKHQSHTRWALAAAWTLSVGSASESCSTSLLSVSMQRKAACTL